MTEKSRDEDRTRHEVPSQEVDEIFASYLDELANDVDASFDVFLARYPEWESRLRDVYENWKKIEGALNNSDGPCQDLSRDERDALLDSNPLLNRLSRRVNDRYQREGTIDEGGMGAIHKIWDEDLRRYLAMKVLKEDPSRRRDSRVDSRTTRRFLEEAQVTGQLEHPAIPPIHELGIDQHGNLYFTMPLIRGQNLCKIIGLAKRKLEGWTAEKILRVIIKVCEAVAYAHSKGVLHRDLKPANIMVGRFGETYVMDWGLARIEGEPDRRNIRLAAPDSGSQPIRTDRSEEASVNPQSPWITVDGDVIGTPAYMPPEQAHGHLELLSKRSDVYSIGAILYHLLSGRVPFEDQVGGESPHQLLERVKNGTPTSISSLAPRVHIELVKICEKAMARKPEDRYDDVMDLARDVEAFLSHRPTTTMKGHFLQILWLAVLRNKAVSVVSLAGALILGTSMFFFITGLSERNDELNSKNAHLEDAIAAKDRFLAMTLATSLLVDSRDLYPPTPERVPALKRWIQRVDDLTVKKVLFEDELRLAEASGVGPESLVEITRTIERIDELLALRPHFRENLSKAESLETLTVDEVRETWEFAIEAIRTSPFYEGLEIEPQIGLIPLEENEFGYWEFWHYLSGEEPLFVPDADRDAPKLTPESGIILVLLPGGVFEMGSPLGEPGREQDETPRKRHLTPFFISKFEVTQAQWLRLMGKNPSRYYPERVEGWCLTESNPVENISWVECREFSKRADLSLPSEAQWEFACRAGSQTPYHWGTRYDDAENLANVMDQSHPYIKFVEQAEWNDGFPAHAPVGSFPPNGFGLHDMVGNVFEWCADAYSKTYPPETNERGNHLVDFENPECRVFRGSCWYYYDAPQSRSARRGYAPAKTLNHTHGLRPVRDVRGSWDFSVK